MIKTFHHGGRMGDLVFSLYTVKALGGGNIALSKFHTPGWDFSMAESMFSFLEYQEYIEIAHLLDVSDQELRLWRSQQIQPIMPGIEFDLHEAENDYNPDAFPEWHGKRWPGNCHLAKRYAVHFGIDWNPDAIWLTAPKTKTVDVVFHMPKRRCVRGQGDWFRTLRKLKQSGVSVLIIGGTNDIYEWSGCDIQTYTPHDFLTAADYINSAKVFVGGASSCNSVAEGLKKRRIIELADDCDDVYPFGETGHYANDMSSDQIIELVHEIVK